MHLSDRGVWNIEAFQAGKEIIVCAGLWDALTFWNAGYRNVTCTFGADALTDDHLAAFREFGIRRVLVTAAEIAPAAVGSRHGLLSANLAARHGRERLRLASRRSIASPRGDHSQGGVAREGANIGASRAR